MVLPGTLGCIFVQLKSESLLLTALLPAAGLVLAAELSSTVEPLTHVASLPVHRVMDFLRHLIRNTVTKPM